MVIEFATQSSITGASVRLCGIIKSSSKHAPNTGIVLHWFHICSSFVLLHLFALRWNAEK